MIIKNRLYREVPAQRWVRHFPRLLTAAMTALTLNAARLSAQSTPGTVTVNVEYNGAVNTGTLYVMAVSSSALNLQSIAGSTSTAVSGTPVSSTVTLTLPANVGDNFNVYAFIAPAGDNTMIPKGTEPMGGVGPFPTALGAGTAYTQPVPINNDPPLKVRLFNRGEIDAVVLNRNTTTGSLVVKAYEDLGAAAPDATRTRTVTLPAISGGNAILDGLIPSATPYTVMAFVDTNGNGQRDTYEAKTTTAPFTISTGTWWGG